MQLVKRTWGYYITLLDRKHFKVKMLRFNKGGQLSRQYHKNRSELWLFLTGNDKGNYKVIQRFEMHTYYALSKTWILEIQYGESCQEKDIVRV